MWSWLVFCCFPLYLQAMETSLSENDINVGEPLLLTPLLEEDKVTEARQLSKVEPAIGNTTSYSGYFTVDKECESNLFFWFFPAQKNWLQAPLVLWLQGGPGVSSLYGMFEEIGPLTYIDELGRRKYSWNVKNNVIFIDQPVGTGYSFTGKGCYAENGTTVGRNLYSAVIQFLQLFPELENNKFFINGGSYAGHFIPQLGHTIHKNNPLAKVKVNLSGMMIGNGWMDPFYQLKRGSHLYHLGLIDDEARLLFDELVDKVSHHIKQQEWELAYDTQLMIEGEVYSKYVGNISVYNFLKTVTGMSRSFVDFVQKSEVRKAIHVGNLTYTLFNDQVSFSLRVDDGTSMRPLLEELLEHYVIVVYNGQLDIICAYPMTVEFLRSLEWSGAAQYRNSTRYQWCVEDQQAGYYKGDHHLYDVMVRKAGHQVPHDQPLWAYVLVNSVTSGTTHTPLHGLSRCSP